MNSFFSRLAGVLLVGAFFIAVSATSASAQCGNGNTQASQDEECDNGTGNNTQRIGCCDIGCVIVDVPGVVECRPASGAACDFGAEYCDGESAACPADTVAPLGTPCRAAVSVCDAVENCDGTSSACPADAFADAATLCRASEGVCDIAETCTGTSNACPSDQKSTAVCRPDAGSCDGGTEFCDGTNDDCPEDNLSPADTLCRAAQGDCDAEETCDGTSGVCPPDVFEPDTVVCRPSLNGICDSEETCTGTSANCPADVFADDTTVCRASGGVCDPAETCTGTSGACPDDAKSTAVCRPDTGSCDGGTEFCDGTNDDCPEDNLSPADTLCRAAQGDCDAEETCDGTSGVCPPNVFEPDTVVCRPSLNGICDSAENCTGTSANCPADVLADAGTLCRASAGVCDSEETCSGTSGACPPDTKSTSVCRPDTGICDGGEEVCDGTNDDCPADNPVNAGTLCRASEGECDLAEECTGTSGECPADEKSTSLCRAAAGDCDIDEFCDGVSDDCPDNERSTEVCRPAVNPECDVEEVCDGTADDCPADVLAGECATLDEDDIACTNAICTESGCVVEETCIEICRGPGYYQTHSGYEKDSANVGQEILDALDGGIEVCGQIVDETTDLGALDSALEGLCMRTQGVKQRQLYRFLLTTAFNCAISEGGDGDDDFEPEECDNILANFVEVKFTECSALCADDPVDEGPTLQECKDQLGCFNKGGRWIDGECVKGTCEIDTDVYCSDDEDCDDEQECEPFEDACTREDLCSEDLTSAAKVCPKKGPASSPKICKDARKNDCTIDSCPSDATCEGRCGGQAPSGCYCDSLSCSIGDGCVDRDIFCSVCEP